MQHLTSLLGLLVMMFLAYLLSSKKSAISIKIILIGVGLQIGFGVLVVWTTPGVLFFSAAREAISSIIGFSDAGASFVFGEGFREHFFAFSVLSTVIFVSSCTAILFYLGVMQRIVKAMGWVMVRLMNVSGAESLAASANVFMGQTEAPLLIKPYIAKMTSSELMTMMVSGMATVAGSVMAAYASFGADPGHLLAASVMSAPAAIVIAKIILPETETPLTRGTLKVDVPQADTNVLDAACRGAGEGLNLALNVAAMLIAFVALAALINYILAFLPGFGGAPISMERVLGWLFSPLAWLMGVPSQDTLIVGSLLGKKMFLNEFIAYIDLKDLKGVISDRSFIISTYALCGFANFSSIAIQVGGIGALVPERRKDLAKLGFKAMLGGTLAANMTACVAGILIP
ncbi:MAG: NupC/NupG family nucleoside CNT transporter [Deltaproteobacteria bacterium CG11_big_fil_rev_8_21_14_0_20_45_16]|nr:MAG: NupC/NupG family nucleoside CNT transporter [Deltaproteobacteria bacterium CG11_big_fil_rev_8_21_14_0_20_45_16]